MDVDQDVVDALAKMTPQEFARRMADAVLQIRSSQCGFIIETAMKGWPGCEFGVGWESMMPLMERLAALPKQET